MPFTRNFILFISFLCCFSSSFGQYLDKFGHYKFFKNYGQWDESVQYAVSTPDGHYFFDFQGFGIVSSKGIEGKPNFSSHQHPHDKEVGHSEIDSIPESVELYMTKFKLLGVSDIFWHGVKSDPTLYSFFIGEKNSWIKGAHTHNELIASSIYRGISIRFVGNEGLKYEFVVAPKANPKKIALSYKGGEMTVNEVGELIVDIGYEKIKEGTPFAYQVVDGKRIRIPCKYSLSRGILTYKLGEYDRTKELVIDPKLIFSTSAGSQADYWGNTACNDQFGNLYTAGTVFSNTGGGFWQRDPITGLFEFIRTPSLNGLPTTPGAFQGVNAGGGTDIGVMKFDSSGLNLIYCTYIGGADSDLPISTVVDRSNGDLLILGVTGSIDFPLGNRLGYDTSFNGGTFISGDDLVGGYDLVNGSDIIVIRLNAGGTDITSATFVGGDGNDGISIDSFSTTYNYGDELRGDIFIADDGGILVASATQTPVVDSFPGIGFNTTYNGGLIDGVAFKLSSDLSILEWSNVLGGPGSDVALSIKEDSLGAIFVGGGSEGLMVNFPTGGYQDTVNNDVDGFVWKISSDGITSLNGTYIGDTVFDQIYFIDLDENDDLFVLGQTDALYPILPTPDSVYNNPRNGLFLAKFTNDLNSLELQTTLGDTTNPIDITANISPTAFLVNECGNIFISGWGGSINASYRGDFIKNMPVDVSSYKSITDGDDFYLMVLYKDAERLLYSTYFGGGVSREHVDGGTSRFDKAGTVYQSVCANCGGNRDFPTFPDDGNNLTYPMRSKSQNCNNGVFKFDLANLEAIIEGPNCLMVGQEYIFENNSIGGRDFEWAFGDGDTVFTLNLEDIAHTYDVGGNYTIRLVATDLVTCEGRDTTYLDVSVLHNIEASQDTTICAGDVVQINVVNAFNPEWFPKTDLSCDKCSSPFASPNDTIEYVVKDSLGLGCSIMDTVVINVNQIPVAIIDGPDCFKAGQEYIFQNNSIGGRDFEWAFGDGNTVFSSSLEDVAHTYAVGGNYTIRLIATDLVTCEESDTTYLNISVLHNIEASKDTTICVGDVVQINVINAVNPEWFPKTGLSCDKCSSPFASPNDTVEYVVKDSLGLGCAIVDTIVINVNQIPIAIIDGPDCLEGGKEYTFQNNSVGGARFEWDFGDGSPFFVTDKPEEVKHTYDTHGLYTISIQVSDVLICKQVISTSLQVAVVTEIQAFLEDTLICPFTSTTLNVTGALNPEWSPVFNLSCTQCSSPVATVSDSIEYIVTDIIKEGCFTTDTVLVRIKEKPSPKLKIETEGYRCYNEPISYKLKISGNDCECCIPIIGWTWDFGDGFTSKELEPVHQYTNEGTYLVGVSAFSYDTLRTELLVNLYTEDSCFKNIYIPNAFTPNNDLENDILYVRGINIIELEFRLYNRWGEEVFMTKRLNFGWDGIYKGQKQSQQVFVYKCYATFYDGEKVELEGNVTLME